MRGFNATCLFVVFSILYYLLSAITRALTVRVCAVSNAPAARVEIDELHSSRIARLGDAFRMQERARVERTEYVDYYRLVGPAHGHIILSLCVRRSFIYVARMALTSGRVQLRFK